MGLPPIQPQSSFTNGALTRLSKPNSHKALLYEKSEMFYAKEFFFSFFLTYTQKASKVCVSVFVCAHVCNTISAVALPPFSCTTVWEIPVAEAAEAAKAFNTRQTVI